MKYLRDGKLRVARDRSIMGTAAGGGRRIFGPGTEIGPKDLPEPGEKEALFAEGALVYDGISAEELQAEAEAHGFDRPVDFLRQDGSVVAPAVPTHEGASIVDHGDERYVRGEVAKKPLKGDAPHTPEVADRVQRMQDQAKRKPHSVEIRRPGAESEEQSEGGVATEASEQASEQADLGDLES